MVEFFVLGFCVAWESPSELVVNNFREAVMLYCLSSFHGASTYYWKKFGNASSHYPSTPVIYVHEGGLYQCSIKLDSHTIQGSIINVRVELGK